VGFGQRTGFATSLMRGLLALALASLAFSATTVAALGLEDLRMVLFAAVFAALALGATLVRPRFGARDRMAPLVACWLLALLALVAQFTALGALAGPLDYKIALPILALLLAPNLRAAVGDLDLARFALGAGMAYVLLTAAVALAVPSTAMLRNIASSVRVDITGSVVLHASLCTITALVAAAALSRPRGRLLRLGAALTLAAAAWMVMLTGTRSALMALGFFVLLWACTGRAADLTRPRAIGLGLLALAAFLLLSLLASDTIWSRLVALGHDSYSSGRGPSLRHWLALAAGEPFGLGIGAVRHLLAQGRPTIAGGHLLEWPHNEFVRFYVEGGVLGFTLVLVVVGDVVRRAARRARVTADPVERVLLLALAADLLTQCLLQNYFNSVYHATVMVMLVGMLAAGEEERRADGRG
jgi:O-antigen ligase